MQSNLKLIKSRKIKNDEFYTQYEDVEKELVHYKKHLKDKVVYCNCDKPVSNFIKYFVDNFHDLGLKELIFTHYENPTSTATIYDGNIFTKSNLVGNGSFESNECIALLQRADVVVTNPPFSLFRRYIVQLIMYNKRFLIIGNKNAVTYNEIFPLIKDKKLWLGVSSPDQFEIPNGELTTKLKGLCRWFTNLDYPKRYENLTLYETYTPEKYPKYTNYNAINVDRIKEIPMNYYGEMGVPITFLDSYNPHHFEIIGLGHSRKCFTPTMNFLNAKKFTKNGESDGGAINSVLTLNVNEKPVNKTYYTADNIDGYLIPPYTRLLIKRK